MERDFGNIERLLDSWQNVTQQQCLTFPVPHLPSASPSKCLTFQVPHLPSLSPPSGIKAIKLYAWEDAYVERISALRELELKQIRRTQLLTALNTAVFMVRG